MPVAASRPPSDFYSDDDDIPLQQGDVVFAPVARLASAHASFAPATGLIDRLQEQFAQVSSVVTPPAAELGPDLRVQVGWGPVVVVSHDCQLDKDFNRRYTQLREEGRTKTEAIRLAEADPNLDRWVMVAPVLALDPERGDEADAQRVIAMARGEIVGLFPVEESADRGVPGGVVDLTSISTIDRHAILARLASMGVSTRASLRLALARSAALRTPELGFELESIVGDRVVAARRTGSSPLVVELELRNSGTITLMTPPGEPPTGGPSRTATSAPGVH